MATPRIILAALTGAALVTITGCSSPSSDVSPTSSASIPTSAAPPPTGSSTPPSSSAAPPAMPNAAPVRPPALSSADGSDPESVARVVLLTMYTVDSTRDTSFTDGLRRADALLNSGYAAKVTNAPIPTPDARWQEWTQHRAYTSASAKPLSEQHPPDSAKKAYRTFAVTVTAVGRDGWRGQPERQTVYVALDHQTGGWVVTQVGVQ